MMHKPFYRLRVRFAEYELGQNRGGTARGHRTQHNDRPDDGPSAIHCLGNSAYCRRLGYFPRRIMAFFFFDRVGEAS